MRIIHFILSTALVVTVLVLQITSANAAEIKIPIPEGLIVLLVVPVIYVVLRGAKMLFAPAAQPQNQLNDTEDFYVVWYATNRELADNQYTSQVSDTLHYGLCQVRIPQSHKFGSIGSSEFTRAWQRAATGFDDALAIEAADEIDQNTFLQAMGAALVENGDDILVFIHGFNSSFSDAIIRAAQIGFDLKIPGVTAAFCWPSKARVEGYVADAETVRLCEQPLAEFLGMLQAKFPDKRINLMVHSMGNRILAEVLNNLQKYPELSGAKFGQIILAAPDLDARQFRKLAHLYPQVASRTTLYVCAKDKALHVSSTINANDRIGRVPPVIVINGIDTIEASDVDLDFLGHGYYAEAAGVLYDMSMLIHFRSAPASRVRLRKATDSNGGEYWVVRKATFA